MLPASSLILLLLGGAAPVAAQVATAPPPADEIVVTGTKDVERGRQARDFVESISRTRDRGELSRFESAVCPIVIGLPAEQNKAVAVRLRKVAGSIGLRTGSPSCRPNLLVAVVGDKRAFLERLARKQPGLLGSMTPTEYRKLAKDPAPAVAWQRTGLISVNGTELMPDAYYDAYVNRTYGSSPLTTTTAHLHFRAAAVVIEGEAALGLTTTQLADYAAMRSFAHTDPRRVPASADSILAAVGAPAGTAVPVTLTRWDYGYLRGLYASTPDTLPVHRRAEISRKIERELKRAEAKH